MSHQPTRAQGPSGSSGAMTSVGAAEGQKGLRSRKLSLTTRQLPLTTGSQVSPVSTGSSPKNLVSEIGLGLMLDDHASGSEGPPSVDSSGNAGGNGASHAPGSGIGNASSPALRIGDETDEFFRAETAGASIGVGTSSLDDRQLRRSPSARLPQLSTVTTTSGATPSPLQIFTGSPSPSFASTSPIPSPVPLPRPYSPSHQQYNVNSAPPSASTSSHPMSRPPSYNTIMSSSSQQMDRSRSNASDMHARRQSLTSACPPVTASLSGYATPKSDVTAFSPASSTGPRGWRTYDWGVPREKLGDGQEDVREGAKHKGATAETGMVSKILAVPSALLASFLAPLNSTTRSPYSPNLNGASSPSKPTSGGSPSKRYPLLVRLLTISYLVFSFLFLTVTLTSKLLSPASSDSVRAKLESRGGQEGWQLMRSYADGLGQKAGIDLSWAHYKGADGIVGQSGQVEAVGSMDSEAEQGDDWGVIRRIGHPDQPVNNLEAADAKQNPLTPFTHTYRFSKMHEKVHWDLHDEIVPFAFHASSKPTSDDVTACLYSNPAWLSALPSFLRSWRGPVSLIFETTHSRLDTSARSALLADIQALRDSDTLVKTFVDFHLVGAPSSMSERTLNKTRERMIKNPSAQNYQLNLARFFARTDVVFLAGDARLVPSGGLRRRLTSPGIRQLVLDKGDAVVVPSFGFVRDPTADPLSNPVPSLANLRTRLALGANSEVEVGEATAGPADAFAGIGSDEFEPLAAGYVRALYETLPLQPDEWPSRKQQLVQLVNTRVPSPETPTTALLALLDKRWDINHGPTNWYLWRKSSADPRLREKPSAGGGLGLGVDGTIGGGKDVYRVVDYDLHYSPYVVTSRKGQPWCTERFDDVRAACVYQMYLTGAEMWVLPDEWVYTLEPLEKRPESDKEDPADKLRNSISSRLYGKFHQEACMHYGREFLSVGMWDSDKAQHLRETCARTLSSWGMGSG
ncbi:hypothetical protein JCM10212_001741 [Sporobolomyces blumeae]